MRRQSQHATTEKSGLGRAGAWGSEQIIPHPELKRLDACESGGTQKRPTTIRLP
jgi:hypothetical protein